LVQSKLEYNSKAAVEQLYAPWCEVPDQPFEMSKQDESWLHHALHGTPPVTTETRQEKACCYMHPQAYKVLTEHSHREVRTQLGHGRTPPSPTAVEKFRQKQAGVDDDNTSLETETAVLSNIEGTRSQVGYIATMMKRARSQCDPSLCPDNEKEPWWEASLREKCQWRPKPRYSSYTPEAVSRAERERWRELRSKATGKFAKERADAQEALKLERAHQQLHQSSRARRVPEKTITQSRIQTQGPSTSFIAAAKQNYEECQVSDDLAETILTDPLAPEPRMDISKMNDYDVRRYFRFLFQFADKDRNGELDRHELLSLMAASRNKLPCPPPIPEAHLDGKRLLCGRISI